MDIGHQFYTHEGTGYVRDTFTGETTKHQPGVDWAAMAREIFRRAEEIERQDPNYAEKKKKKDQIESRRQSKKDQYRAEKDRLTEIAKGLVPWLGKVTEEEIAQWRIDNGYLWQVTSPTGKVYKEVLKNVTPKDPDDFVLFTAMKMAYQRSLQAE